MSICDEDTGTSLQLVDLALFVVLEIGHVLLQLLDLRLGLLLLLLRGLDGSLKIGHGLLHLLDLATDLAYVPKLSVITSETAYNRLTLDALLASTCF